MKAEPVQGAAYTKPKSIWDKIPVIKTIRACPWKLMAKVYMNMIIYAYEKDIEAYGNPLGVFFEPLIRKLRSVVKGHYACYRLKRFCLIPIGLLLGATASAQSMEFPLANYYENGFLDREQPLPREGLTYSRMMDHLQVGLPIKDRIRLDIRTNEGQRVLACQFRFGSNYEALLEQLRGTAFFGPDTLQNPPMGILYQWFDPALRIQLSLGYRGGVSNNGVANYRYEIEPMDAVTQSRFYKGKDGRWQRLPIIGATVQIAPITTFYDKLRTLRDDVLPADSLAAYMSAPAVSEVICLHHNIPRRSLPSKGQVYYTPRCSEAFPYGFLGKVSAIKREGDKHLIYFEEVRELELFDVSNESY